MRKSDIENNLLDGGKLIILNGNVYDIQNYECENLQTSEILLNNLGKDVSSDLNQSQHRIALEFITTNFRIGKYATSDSDDKNNQKNTIIITHFDSERALSYLLGLRSGLLQKGPALQPAEIQCKNMLKSLILSGGLQVLQPTNPFDEEKGEARSSASTAGSTPTEASINMPVTEKPEPCRWPHSVSFFFFFKKNVFGRSFQEIFDFLRNPSQS